MLRNLVVTVLSILLICTMSVTALAQGESGFVQEESISKGEAIVLSALFPGLGQMTQGQNVKGLSFFMAEAFSLVVFFNSHENYKTKQKVYERDLDIYHNEASFGRYSDALTLYNELSDESDDLDNLHTYRNTALILAGVTYAANLVDVLLFSPSTSESRRADIDYDRVTVQSAMIDRAPGIVLSKRF